MWEGEVDDSASDGADERINTSAGTVFPLATSTVVAPHEPTLYKYPPPQSEAHKQGFRKNFFKLPKKRKKQLRNGFHFVSVRLLRRRRPPSSPPPTRPDPCRGASGLRRRNALRGGHAVRSARATARGDSAGGEGSV